MSANLTAASSPTTDTKKLRAMLRRIATHALRAEHWLEHRDFELGTAHAAVAISHARDLLKRAEVMLIRDPELRAEMLAECPQEPPL